MVAGGRREDQSLSTEYKVGGGRENVENYRSSNCHRRGVGWEIMRILQSLIGRIRKILS